MNRKGLLRQLLWFQIKKPFGLQGFHKDIQRFKG